MWCICGYFLSVRTPVVRRTLEDLLEITVKSQHEQNPPQIQCNHKILFDCYMAYKHNSLPLRIRVPQAGPQKMFSLNILIDIQIQNIEFKQLYFKLLTFSHLPLLHIYFLETDCNNFKH